MKCELSTVAARTDCQGFLSGRENAIALKFHGARRLTIKAWDALRAGGADQPLDVLRRRPDIIAAERRLAASNERIGVAISDYYPKISLSGALGFDSINGGTLFNGKAFQPIGTGALRWRLFDFG